MIGRVFSFSNLRRQPYMLLRRQFSVKAIYSSFPATLHYYCPRRTSSLFDHQETESRSDDIYDEGVAIHKNGLVYPAVNASSVSNGAVMFPNTFLMQELVRRYFDEALDREDEGKQVETPFIYTLPKDLNRSLDEFYNKHARKETAEEWLDAHPFQQAVADDADAVWMAK
ncbi:hypothetical protein MANI_029727 [Metarhizium anisopliae]